MGSKAEAGGIAKNGAKMVMAVACAQVGGAPGQPTLSGLALRCYPVALMHSMHAASRWLWAHAGITVGA